MSDDGRAERGRRIRLNAPVALTIDGGSRVEARLLDLSSSGFRIESDELLQVGEQVTLHMDGEEPMAASIRWVTGFTAGGSFTAPPPVTL